MIPRKFLSIKNFVMFKQVKNMARGRNYYIQGASKDTGISPVTRDLLANVKHAENIEEWQVEPGIGHPIKFSQYRENVEDYDDAKDLDMVYFPHKGQEPWPQDYQASPVLLVKRVKSLKGEPWWHKQDCERIGLGLYAVQDLTRVALPNLSFYNALLYRIKHLIEVVPVQFPDGVPSPEEFDAKCAKVTDDGQFLYGEKIGDKTAVFLQDECESDRLKMTEETHRKESNKSWLRPFTSSPYGNGNYHRDFTVSDPQKSDFITDSSNKIKY